MWKLKSDSGFFDFLKRKGASGKLVAFLTVGVVLLLIGTRAGEKAEEPEASSGTESELVEMFSELQGVGECKVKINYTEGGEVSAVAVLCEGAESDAVKKRIYDLVGSLYGIGTNRIAVLKIRE